MTDIIAQRTFEVTIGDSQQVTLGSTSQTVNHNDVTYNVISGSWSGRDITAIHTDVAGEIAGLDVKAAPVAADKLLIEDSAAGDVKKHILFSAVGGGGGGDVAKSGTPANNQVAVWTDDSTIEGEAELTYDGATLLVQGDLSTTGECRVNVDGSSVSSFVYFRPGNTHYINYDHASGTFKLSHPLLTDIVTEETPGSGVTVDSVLLKDGLVDGIDVATDVAANTAHRGTSTGNPHSVTAANVGLDQLHNTTQVRNMTSSFSTDFATGSPASTDMYLYQRFATGQLRYGSFSALPLSDAATTALAGKSDTSHTHAAPDFIHLTKTSAANENIGGAGGTTAAITWDSELHKDSATFTHSTSSSNHQITVASAGRYYIKATVGCSMTVGGGRITPHVYVRVNSTPNKLGGSKCYIRGSGYGGGTLNIITEIELSASDIVDIESLVDDADGTYTVPVTYDECEMIIRKMD